MTLILRGKAREVFAILWRMAHPAPAIGEIRCAWCGVYMGARLGITGTTLGVCPACIEKETKEAK